MSTLQGFLIEFFIKFCWSKKSKKQIKCRCENALISRHKVAVQKNGLQNVPVPLIQHQTCSRKESWIRLPNNCCHFTVLDVANRNLKRKAHVSLSVSLLLVHKYTAQIK